MTEELRLTTVEIIIHSLETTFRLEFVEDALFLFTVYSSLSRPVYQDAGHNHYTQKREDSRHHFLVFGVSEEPAKAHEEPDTRERQFKDELG